MDIIFETNNKFFNERKKMFFEIRIGQLHGFQY